jgi:nickel-dependent lactate racemase
MYSKSEEFFVFMEHSVILWNSLQIIMNICGPEREDKDSLEHHINRKFMVNSYQNSEI